jgi:hypothetical protein
MIPLYYPVLRFLGISFLCSTFVLNSIAAQLTLSDSIPAHSDHTDFRIGSENIGTLPAGTKGLVLGTPEKLQSGSYGVYFTITEISQETGQLKVGSNVWVYFNHDPSRNVVELYDDDHKKVSDPTEGVWAKTTKEMKPFATVNAATLKPKPDAEVKAPFANDEPYTAENSCLTTFPIELKKMGLDATLAALVKQSETEKLIKPSGIIAVRKNKNSKSVIYSNHAKRVEYKNGSRSWRDHNPGNLDSAKNEIGRNGEACFASDLDGLVALRDLLISKYENKSISNMFNIYATAHVGYAKFVAKKTKIDPKKQLKNYSKEEISLLMGAIILKEGYSPGEVVDLGSS